MRRTLWFRMEWSAESALVAACGNTRPTFHRQAGHQTAKICVCCDNVGPTSLLAAVWVPRTTPHEEIEVGYLAALRNYFPSQYNALLRSAPHFSLINVLSPQAMYWVQSRGGNPCVTSLVKYVECITGGCAPHETIHQKEGGYVALHLVDTKNNTTFESEGPFVALCRWKAYMAFMQRSREAAEYDAWKAAIHEDFKAVSTKLQHVASASAKVLLGYDACLRSRQEVRKTLSPMPWITDLMLRDPATGTEMVFKSISGLSKHETEKLVSRMFLQDELSVVDEVMYPLGADTVPPPASKMTTPDPQSSSSLSQPQSANTIVTVLNSRITKDQGGFTIAPLHTSMSELDKQLGTLKSNKGTILATPTDMGTTVTIQCSQKTFQSRGLHVLPTMLEGLQKVNKSPVNIPPPLPSQALTEWIQKQCLQVYGCDVHLWLTACGEDSAQEKSIHCGMLWLQRRGSGQVIICGEASGLTKVQCEEILWEEAMRHLFPQHATQRGIHYLPGSSFFPTAISSTEYQNSVYANVRRRACAQYKTELIEIWDGNSASVIHPDGNILISFADSSCIRGLLNCYYELCPTARPEISRLTTFQSATNLIKVALTDNLGLELQTSLENITIGMQNLWRMRMFGVGTDGAVFLGEGICRQTKPLEMAMCVQIMDKHFPEHAAAYHMTLNSFRSVCKLRQHLMYSLV
eukprot:PhF_6_TR3745/c0_g1_i1/m.5399